MIETRGNDMRRGIKTIIVTVLFLALASSAVFAEAISEMKEEASEFSSLDFETESYQRIMDSFEAAMSSYEADVKSLYSRMEKAISEGNFSDYFEAKDFLKVLAVPTVTYEQTEILVSRILNETDTEAKAGFAEWLFNHSVFYSPGILLTKESKDEDRSRSFSFRYQVRTKPGSKVTLPAFDGYYKADEGIFVGWGITPEEVTYKAGEEVEMPYTDVTLYAVFKPGVLFYDTVTGTEVLEDGEVVSAPELSAPDDSYVFLGWYNGLGEKLQDADSIEREGSATYYAKWRSLDIKDVGVRYYNGLSIPAEEQVRLTFSVRNQGNRNAGSFTVYLVPEDEGTLKVLSGSISTYSLMAGQSKNGSFTLVAHGNSGDKVNASIVVTDADGNTWAEPVTLTIK